MRIEHKAVVLDEEGWWMVWWCPIGATRRTEGTLVHLSHSKSKAFAVAQQLRAAYIVTGDNGF